MSDPGHRFEGGCHCGNLAYVFRASAGLNVLGLRACVCTFCRSHGARTTSDPRGTVHLSVRDGEKLHRYGFGLKSADFLLCRDCGVYIGALINDGSRMWITINANSFREKPPLDFPLTAHEYGAEDLSSRMARRKQKWTPVADMRIG